MQHDVGSLEHTPTTSSHAPGSVYVSPLILALILFLVALLPRILPPDAFVTVDEAYHWFDRTDRFLKAVQDGDYAATNLVGHPGITTMWLGSLGAVTHNALVDAGWVAPQDAGLRRMALRLPITLVTSFTIVLAYLLLLRLLEQGIALLAVLLWATDPFLVAHSQLLHVDALLASFMMLALLAALVALRDEHDQLSDVRHQVRWPFFVASAVAGGLAFLTKSPSVVLLPMIGVMILLAMWCSGGVRGVVRVAVLALLWGSIAAGVWVALWPAAWVDLPGAVGRIVMQVRYEGGEPHAWGNFFLGRAVDDPGPLFYPVATALRLTPWALIGLFVALIAWLRATLRRDQTLLHSSYRVVGVLVLFILIFAVLLTLAPKKFDRYMLPLFPAINIIAACGLWSIRQWIPGIGRGALGTGRGIIALVRVVVVLNIAWYHPYEMAYYNPLLGGGPVAARTIPVGWGEGFDLAGEYITSQFNGCDYPVASWFESALAPFTCTPVVPLVWAREPGKVDYVVLYIDQVQRQNRPEVTQMLQTSGPPVHTVRIHGIEYAAIYQLPPLIEQPVVADFGSVIRLHGYAIGTESLRSSGVVTVTLHWQARKAIDDDYALFLHLLTPGGEPVSQVDVPPGGPRAPTSIWESHQYITWFHPVPVPADLAAGTYWLALGIYAPDNFARLPLRADVPAGAPNDGSDALLLGPLYIPPPRDS